MEVAVDFGHKFLHVLAAVVASNVVVKILPDPLDPIVIGAIRWQKVESHLAAPCGQCQLDLAAVVDLVVVEDDVDPTSLPVGGGHQPVDEQEEQNAVLAFSLDPSELTRASVKRPRQVTLLVLTWCLNLLLNSA